MTLVAVATGELVSFFVQKPGRKLFAARGKVEIQAQGDEMHLMSEKDRAIRESPISISVTTIKAATATSTGCRCTPPCTPSSRLRSKLAGTRRSRYEGGLENACNRTTSGRFAC
ncbi:DUF2345 domain-containing protein [Burkholderia territorii]|uniref:DUF2345 domain-containing protein n=1 Tax=Burkholderia territorii TaxID=1503055 RepID=UPI0009C039B6